MGTFKHKEAIVTILLVGYLVLAFFTSISLTGIWTDIFFSIVLSIIALRITFKNKAYKRWLTLTLRITTVMCSLILLRQVGLKLIDPFSWNTLKVRSFYFQKVDGRLFNAYFEPVGAYSGGEGNFWITESPKYFPLVEASVYYEHAVLHNFNNDTFDGSRVDNYEVVRSYIKEEIIDKHR
jgi:energy-coupling factor transporter transmembrane protein EcfT